MLIFTTKTFKKIKRGRENKRPRQALPVPLFGFRWLGVGKEQCSWLCPRTEISHSQGGGGNPPHGGLLGGLEGCRNAL